MNPADRSLGRLGRVPVDELARRAAEVVRGYQRPRAVCVAPNGEVSVEAFKTAIPDEVLGNFSPQTPWPELDRLIRDELVAEFASRRSKRA